MSEKMTTSTTGGMKATKEERYDLLPKPALDAIARVYAFGATKYADHNWRKRYEWSKSYAAAMRHLTAFWNGETCDSESGLPHLAHAGFHMFAMLTWLEEDGEAGEFDDRYRALEPADVIEIRSLGGMVQHYAIGLDPHDPHSWPPELQDTIRDGLLGNAEGERGLGDVA